jgi:hypothetical protein
MLGEEAWLAGPAVVSACMLGEEAWLAGFAAALE